MARNWIDDAIDSYRNGDSSKVLSVFSNDDDRRARLLDDERRRKAERAQQELKAEGERQKQKQQDLENSFSHKVGNPIARGVTGFGREALNWLGKGVLGNQLANDAAEGKLNLGTIGAEAAQGTGKLADWVKEKTGFDTGLTGLNDSKKIEDFKNRSTETAKANQGLAKLAQADKAAYNFKLEMAKQAERKGIPGATLAREQLELWNPYDKGAIDYRRTLIGENNDAVTSKNVREAQIAQEENSVSMGVVTPEQANADINLGNEFDKWGGVAGTILPTVALYMAGGAAATKIAAPEAASTALGTFGRTFAANTAFDIPAGQAMFSDEGGGTRGEQGAIDVTAAAGISSLSMANKSVRAAQILGKLDKAGATTDGLTAWNPQVVLNESKTMLRSLRPDLTEDAINAMGPMGVRKAVNQTIDGGTVGMGKNKYSVTGMTPETLADAAYSTTNRGNLANSFINNATDAAKNPDSASAFAARGAQLQDIATKDAVIKKIAGDFGQDYEQVAKALEAHNTEQVKDVYRKMAIAEGRIKPDNQLDLSPNANQQKLEFTGNENVPGAQGAVVEDITPPRQSPMLDAPEGGKFTAPFVGEVGPKTPTIIESAKKAVAGKKAASKKAYVVATKEGTEIIEAKDVEKVVNIKNAETGNTKVITTKAGKTVSAAEITVDAKASDPRTFNKANMNSYKKGDIIVVDGEERVFQELQDGKWLKTKKVGDLTDSTSSKNIDYIEDSAPAAPTPVATPKKEITAKQKEGIIEKVAERIKRETPNIISDKTAKKIAVEKYDEATKSITSLEKKGWEKMPEAGEGVYTNRAGAAVKKLEDGTFEVQDHFGHINTFENEDLMNSYVGRHFTEKTPIQIKQEKLAKKAYDHILKNDGITIKTGNNVQPKEGFVYSMEKGKETIVPAKELSEDHIETFLRDNWNELSKPGNHFGAWLDDGDFYLDVSIVGKDQAKAVADAFGKEQIAVWDLAKGTGIETGWKPVSVKAQAATEAVDDLVDSPKALKTGKQNVEFFTGKAEKPSSDVPYTPTIETPQVSGETKAAFSLYTMGGNFTGHISKMIPGFAEKQMAVTEAIIKSDAKSFLDIGASEGGVVKTVSARNPKIKSVALDPNRAMKANFDATPAVKNTEYKLEALGGSWVEDDGFKVKQFSPKNKFDVINEDYAFQFINSDRAGQLKEVKKMLNKDGLFVSSEKFHTADFEANETAKLAHQSKYFSPDQLTEDKQTIVSGMSDDMVKDTAYEKLLKKNFKYVTEYWNSGNFKGYVATNSKAKLNKFLADVGDVNSEFSVVQTPRAVTNPGAKAIDEAPASAYLDKPNAAVEADMAAKQAAVAPKGFDEAAKTSELADFDVKIETAQQQADNFRAQGNETKAGMVDEYVRLQETKKAAVLKELEDNGVSWKGNVAKGQKLIAKALQENSKNMYGFVGGMSMEQDENGNMKMKFDPMMAAMGMVGSMAFGPKGVQVAKTIASQGDVIAKSSDNLLKTLDNAPQLSDNFLNAAKQALPTPKAYVPGEVVIKNTMSDGAIIDELTQRISYAQTPEEVEALFAQAKVNVPDKVNLIDRVFRPFNVMAGLDGGDDMKNIVREAQAEARLTNQVFRKDSLERLGTFGRLSDAENFNFIYKIQQGNLESITPALREHAEVYKHMADIDAKMLQEINPDLNLLDHYFTQSGLIRPLNPDSATGFVGRSMGSTGFTKKRVFENVGDLVQWQTQNADRYALMTSNPETLAASYHANVSRAYMADKIIKEARLKGIDEKTVNSMIEYMKSSGLGNSPIYKTVTEANAGINSFALGLSGFHATMTTANSMVSSLGQGLKEITQGRLGRGLVDVASTPIAPVQDLLKGRNVRAAIKTAQKSGAITAQETIDMIPNLKLRAQVQEVIRAGGGFGIDDIYTTRSVQRFKDAFNGLKAGDKLVKNSAKLAVNTPLAILSKFSEPLMAWYVPNLKVGAFLRIASSELDRVGVAAADTKNTTRILANAWDSIDNRFGQLVKDNLFWNKTLEDAAYAASRSAGWNIGSIKELGGGAVDILDPKQWKRMAQGEGMSNRTAYLVALPLTAAMIGGTYNYLATGEAPKDSKDWFNPRTGALTPNGEPERIEFPTYMKDLASWTSDPVQTAMNKMSPTLGLGTSLISNKDWKGDLIRNPDASAIDQTKQVGSHIANTFMPFALAKTKQRLEDTGENKVRAGIESFLGFNPAKRDVTMSEVEKKLYDVAGRSKMVRTPEQVKADSVKADIRKKIREGKATEEDMQTLLDNGVSKSSLKNYGKEAAKSSVIKTFETLSLEEKKNFLASLSEGQRKEIKNEYMTYQKNKSLGEKNWQKYLTGKEKEVNTGQVMNEWAKWATDEESE